MVIDDLWSKDEILVDCCKVNRTPLSPWVPIQIGQSVMKIEYKNYAEVKVAKNLLYRAAIDGLTGIFEFWHFIKLASMEIFGTH